MTIIYSLLPFMLFIFAGYLFWFRDSLVTLLNLKNDRMILALCASYSLMGILGVIFIALHLTTPLLILLLIVVLFSVAISIALSFLLK